MRAGRRSGARRRRDLIRERMQALEEKLDPRVFFRTHRSRIEGLEERLGLSR